MVTTEERKKAIRTMCESYVKKSPYVLNPDKERVDFIINGLDRNEEKHGWRFCPCRIVTGDIKVDYKTICPCHWHKEEIKEQGFCKCILFTSEEWAKQKEEELKW